jgi:hypothetical protein
MLSDASLAAADRATNHSDRKSASSPGELDSDKTSTPTVKTNCAMCMTLKEMGCPFIKYHQELTACPPSNIEMARILLVKRPPSFNTSKHPSTNSNPSSSSNATASSVTDSYNSRNQSTAFGSQPNRYKTIPPLPSNFDIYRQCKNCFWSGQDNGQHSTQRRLEWEHHGTTQCPWQERKSQLNQLKSERAPYNANSSSSTPHTSPPASVLTNYSRSSVRSRSTQDGGRNERSRSRYSGYSDRRGSDRYDRDGYLKESRDDRHRDNGRRNQY